MDNRNNYNEFKTVFANDVEPVPSKQEQPQYRQPQYQQPQYQQPQYVQAPQQQTPLPAGVPQPRQILTMGIVSLALSTIPIAGIVGIILGAIGLSKSNAYTNAGGVRCGMSVTGRILSRVGLIVSICMTVFWIIYFIFIIGIITWAIHESTSSGYHIY